MVSVAELNQPSHVNQWCLGCGDFGILLAIKNAVSELGLNPKDVVIVSGVGCGSKLPHYVKTYGFEGLHGRPLPPASAIKLANNDLAVIAVGGDGDGYGLGMGHFIHSLRRNIDMTYIVENNQVYGLTTGQTSPTTAKGTCTKSTPFGAIEEPVNPLALALAASGTFVARGFSGDLKHLTELIKKAVDHKGFSFIDCLQPCVTYHNSYAFFQKNCYKLQEMPGYDVSNHALALQKALEWNGGDAKVPIGVFYQQKKPTYEDELPQIKDVPAAKQPINDIDITPILDRFV